MSKHRFIPRPSKRTWIGLVLALLLVSLAFQTATAAERSMQPRAGLRLPRLIITLDESGAATELSLVVEGDKRLRFPTTHLTLLSSLLGFDLSSQMFDVNTMQALTDADTQHVGLQTGPAGIAMYGNGELMLAVKWGDQAALDQLADLGEAVQVPLASMARDVVPQIGVDVLIELPTPAGVEPVAPHPFSAGVEFPEPAPLPDLVPIVLHASGEYAADGTAYAFGEPLSRWGTLFGADLSILDLNPAAVSAFQDAGIQNLSLRMDNVGVSLRANENPVVTVILGDEETLTLATLLAQRFQIPFGELIPVAARAKTLDVALTVDLPGAE